MKNSQKLITGAALLWLVSAAGIGPAYAASPDDNQGGASAQCFFTSAPGAWGEDPAKPGFPTLDAVACRGPESLYVVCRPATGGWMQFKQAQRFRLEIYFPGADVPRVRELPAVDVWKNSDAPLMATLWKPGDKDLAGEFGIDKKQVENLCPPQLEDKEQAPPAIAFTMAWGRSVEQAPDSDAGDSKNEAVMEYKQIVSSALHVDPALAAAPPEFKAVPPPDANAVKDAVRIEWPNRYPDFTYLDGVISDASKTAGGPDANIYTYAMNVTLQDQDGNQLSCNVNDIHVRCSGTGSLQIVDLPFDLIQNCR